jgi:hypothetical protein
MHQGCANIIEFLLKFIILKPLLCIFLYSKQFTH